LHKSAIAGNFWPNQNWCRWRPSRHRKYATTHKKSIEMRDNFRSISGAQRSTDKNYGHANCLDYTTARSEFWWIDAANAPEVTVVPHTRIQQAYK